MDEVDAVEFNCKRCKSSRKKEKRSSSSNDDDDGDGRGGRGEGGRQLAASSYYVLSARFSLQVWGLGYFRLRLSATNFASISIHHLHHPLESPPSYLELIIIIILFARLNPLTIDYCTFGGGTSSVTSATDTRAMPCHAINTE